MPTKHQSVALLDADPDLAVGIGADELSRARQLAIAALVEIDGPAWDPARFCAAADDGWLGLFVVDGLLLRRVQIGKRFACELFGPGDLVRPWDAESDYYPVTTSVDWLVLKPATLAVLDRAFALRVARWPSITSRLVGRVTHRARCLALTQAVTHIPRAHARVLLLFWLFAERWGRVGSAGVHVEIPLTHEVIAMLAGAHRPTITIALQRLARTGLLIRQAPDRWLVTSRALELLSDPESLRLVDDGDDPPEMAEAGRNCARAALGER